MDAANLETEQRDNIGRYVNMLINSSPPSDAYMRLWTRSALVQVMTCRLFGAKPLADPMLTYCRLDALEQT